MTLRRLIAKSIIRHRRHLASFFMVFTVIIGASVDIARASDDNDSMKRKLSVYPELSDQYLKAAAKAVTQVQDVGKYRYVDIKEHRCAALAELLGVGGIYLEDTVQPDPGLESRDAHALILYGMSLRNYISSATELMSETNFSHMYKWNLNCSGLYDSSKWFDTDEDGPYEVSVAEDGASIILVGDIVSGMYGRVEALLNTHSAIRSVQLASRGGALSEAMKIGRLIRSRALRTVATDACESSCTLVMIAGAERVIAPPFYSLGFHRITQFDKVVPDDHPDYDAVRKYAADMIGSGDEFVAAWKSGAGASFYRPSLRKLCEMKVATTIQGICGSQ